ncbi:MAG: hypothetical protein E6230_27625, partial [Paenibacillus dendritiformis]|nr:hypothetical protein [Paenibacillus dendritiformis]
KIDLKRSKSQSLDEENGPSPPLHKKQGFSNSLIYAGFRCTIPTPDCPAARFPHRISPPLLVFLSFSRFPRLFRLFLPSSPFPRPFPLFSLPPSFPRLFPLFPPFLAFFAFPPPFPAFLASPSFPRLFRLFSHFPPFPAFTFSVSRHPNHFAIRLRHPPFALSALFFTYFSPWSANCIAAHRHAEHVYALNVFPNPDGDTGMNMKSPIRFIH